MLAFFLLVHVLICLILMVSILMQSSKGGGLAGTFGGAGGGAVFGGRGMGTFLSKVTTIAGVVFFLSSIGHSLYSKGQTQTVQESLIRQDAETRVATPASGLPGIPAQNQATQAQGTEKQDGTSQQKKDDTKQNPAEEKK